MIKVECKEIVIINMYDNRVYAKIPYTHDNFNKFNDMCAYLNEYHIDKEYFITQFIYEIVGGNDND